MGKHFPLILVNAIGARGTVDGVHVTRMNHMITGFENVSVPEASDQDMLVPHLIPHPPQTSQMR